MQAGSRMRCAKILKSGRQFGSTTHDLLNFPPTHHPLALLPDCPLLLPPSTPRPHPAPHPAPFPVPSPTPVPIPPPAPRTPVCHPSFCTSVSHLPMPIGPTPYHPTCDQKAWYCEAVGCPGPGQRQGLDHTQHPLQRCVHSFKLLGFVQAGLHEAKLG